MSLSLRQVWKHVQYPALFLIICILAFGLQIPWLGYYLDDWFILHSYKLGDAAGLYAYAFNGNRPLVFWIWLIGFKLLGFDPVNWQIWTLLWRWLTVVIFWLGWRELWPKAGRQVALAAALFAVYPVFKQQSSALTYSFHWICFFLIGLSYYWMILAIRRPQKYWLLMTGAVLAGAVQLFSQEFFVGMELLRPVVIWLALPGIFANWKERLKRTFTCWLPFAGMIVVYLIWRLRLMPTPKGTDRNTPSLLYGLFTNPLSSLIRLGEMFFQDVDEMLLGIWYKTYEPGLFKAAPLSNLVTWALVIAAFLVVVAFFYFVKDRSTSESEPAKGERPWYQTGLVFGFLAIIFGFAPGWAIGRHIYDLTGVYNDRFGLAASFGAALLLVALLDMLMRKEVYRLVLACLLIALAVGQNFRYATIYRWSNESQRELFWQLKWRAPELKAPTAIVADGDMVRFIGSWATTSALLQMYDPDKKVGVQGDFFDYWFFNAAKFDVSALFSKNAMLKDDDLFMHYSAPARNSLVVTYDNEKPWCVWVLSEKDKSNAYISERTKEILPLSNFNQIVPTSDQSLNPDLFGPEIARDWCYYYQKGSLAAQQGDWQNVTGLWKEAEQQGLHPRVGVEYRPFIVGFAQQSDWDTAYDLTHKAIFPKLEMRKYVCETWQEILSSTADSPERQKTVKSVIEDFECQDELRPLIKSGP